MELKKKDLGNFVQTTVDTRHKIVSDGQVTRRMNPRQISLRLPAEQVEWLNRRIDGNANYAISKMLAKAITELNDKLATQDVNIDDY